jgi:hypothetical protein
MQRAIQQQRRDGAARNVTAPSQPVPEQVESQPESSVSPREQVPSGTESPPSDDDRKLTPKEKDAQNKKEPKD